MLRVVGRLRDILIKAIETDEGEVREELLNDLLSDVCSPIEEEVKVTGELKEYGEECRYYYEAISMFVVKEKDGLEFANSLLTLFTCLWDVWEVRCTYALTMHRWLFRHNFEEHSLKSMMVMIKGANSLFWSDVNALSQLYQPVFVFLILQLTDQEDCMGELDTAVYADLLKLASRFICYYDLSDCEASHLQDLSTFISMIHTSQWFHKCCDDDEGSSIGLVEGSSGCVIEPASIVVMEIVHQLNSICIEEALCRYVEGVSSLKPELVNCLDWQTRIKLQGILHGLGSPGGPLYPPRPVRVRARRTMDFLFPRGRHGRRLVNLTFRLLHPYRWPMSLAHWITVQLPREVWAKANEILPRGVTTGMASAATSSHQLAVKVRQLTSAKYA
eukprot:766635-Hanusia_phi.AAC.2